MDRETKIGECGVMLAFMEKVWKKGWRKSSWNNILNVNRVMVFVGECSIL